MGLLPALFVYAIGLAVFWALKLTSQIYEPAALMLTVTIRTTIIVPVALLWRWTRTLVVFAFRQILHPACVSSVHFSRIFFYTSWKILKLFVAFLRRSAIFILRSTIQSVRVTVLVSTFPVRLTARSMLKLSTWREGRRMAIATGLKVIARAA
jgi:hypothetical protein